MKFDNVLGIHYLKRSSRFSNTFNPKPIQDSPDVLLKSFSNMVTLHQGLIAVVLLVCALTSDAHMEHMPPVPVQGDAMSDHQHFNDNGDHDASYDHEIFLGKDEAKQFDDLDPKLAKEKLR